MCVCECVFCPLGLLRCYVQSSTHAGVERRSILYTFIATSFLAGCLGNMKYSSRNNNCPQTAGFSAVTQSAAISRLRGDLEVWRLPREREILMMMIMRMIALKGSIRDFHNLLAAPRTVSNTYPQVARAQSCANHVQRIERLSRALSCATWYVGTAELSLTGFKSYLF